jgi:hypothetical protein
MTRVQALQNITDMHTGVLHAAGDVFEFDRTIEQLRFLMHEGLLVILDPAISPAIVIGENKWQLQAK